MMMSRHGKTRKKTPEKEQSKESENGVPNYDVISLLGTERQDTKPNLGKFLKTFVKTIRVYNGNKIEMYPTYKYSIEKVFVRFKDDHELVWDRTLNKYYYYSGVEDITLKSDEKELVKRFFDFLFQFKFVR